MRGTRWIAGIWIVTLALPAAGQTIYKCQTAQGPVYAQQPCAEPGGNMTTLELQPDPAPDPRDLARGAAAEAASDEALRQNRLTRDESRCVDSMTAGQGSQSSRKIAAYQRQISALRAQRSHYLDLAGIAYDNGIDAKVTGLQSRIDRERGIMMNNLTNARAICAQRRADADAAGDSTTNHRRRETQNSG
ncbi:MAG TPA: DUF4124 domain-containing protein [Rhodanobacteraceae bacterium]|nr:DUF4124 domain-containing protein [Rhodanobacteraceae bacterium]